MKLPKFKRLLRSDFAAEFQALVDKLAFSLNNTIEGLVNAFNNGISLGDNILCTVKTLQITVDSSNTPITTAVFGMTIPNRPIGVICLNAVNQTNNTSYSTAGITVNWSYNQGTVTVNNITGLIPNNAYQVTLVAFA